jgi:hypothetical protein
MDDIKERLLDSGVEWWVIMVRGEIEEKMKGSQPYQ